MSSVKKISIEKLVISEANVRKHRVERNRLTESIKKEGVLEPIHVWQNPETGSFEIMQGQHRYYGALEAGLIELECIVHSNIPNLEDAKKWCRKQECLHEDLSPLDKLQIALDLEKEYGSLLEGCKKEGLSYSKLSDWYTLRKLCPQLKEGISSEISDSPKLDLPLRDLKEIARFPQSQQLEIAKSIQGMDEVQNRRYLKELKDETSSMPILVIVGVGPYQILKQRASEKNVRLEQLCSEILEQGVN